MEVIVNQPKKKYLWKYMDLFKFLYLIRNKEFYFSSLNDFDDVYESTGKVNAYYLTLIKQMAELKGDKRDPGIEAEVYEQKPFELIDALYGLDIDRSRYFANCFFQLRMNQLLCGICIVEFKDLQFVSTLIQCFFSCWIIMKKI